MEINESIVGKKVLYEVFPFIIIKEGIIEEISPSKEYVKIDGKWFKEKDLLILEVLESKKKPKNYSKQVWGK